MRLLNLDMWYTCTHSAHSAVAYNLFRMLKCKVTYFSYLQGQFLGSKIGHTTVWRLFKCSLCNRSGNLHVCVAYVKSIQFSPVILNDGISLAVVQNSMNEP